MIDEVDLIISYRIVLFHSLAHRDSFDRDINCRNPHHSHTMLEEKRAERNWLVVKISWTQLYLSVDPSVTLDDFL